MRREGIAHVQLSNERRALAVRPILAFWALAVPQVKRSHRLGRCKCTADLHAIKMYGAVRGSGRAIGLSCASRFEGAVLEPPCTALRSPTRWGPLASRTPTVSPPFLASGPSRRPPWSSKRERAGTVGPARCVLSWHSVHRTSLLPPRSLFTCFHSLHSTPLPLGRPLLLPSSSPPSPLPPPP